MRKDEAGFFRGHDEQGRPASEWALMMSIFISWIFAKSVTNAANLGASYGVVGGLAYAAYWLSIPVAGLVIYRLRTREGATGLVPFLIGKYGRGAALAFSLAILIRLFNEVWSNTAVVGGYYGASGSAGFIGVGAAVYRRRAVLQPQGRAAQFDLHRCDPGGRVRRLPRRRAGLRAAGARAGAHCCREGTFALRCRRRPAAGGAAADAVLSRSTTRC